MMMRGELLPAVLCALAVSGGHGSATARTEGAVRHFDEAELASITLPDTAFTETPEITADYDKYFYFQRENTGFDEAYADITECDALASGISYYAGGHEPFPGYYASQYGIGGAIGGLIGAAIADAIRGSATRRTVRRVNMRNCMGFKGYQRFGLPKKLWTEFNFEEGNGRKRDDVREAALRKQALLASGKTPGTKALEL